MTKDDKPKKKKGKDYLPEQPWYLKDCGLPQEYFERRLRAKKRKKENPFVI
ncbi:MAG: hypothetical protein IK100_09555 [Muribaculaceae bacterium]|nr:hypothetical protein [Muribaculaceae bacterium]